MNFRILNSGEKKKLLQQLGERFGISKLNYLLVETGRGKIRAFSGTLNREEILRLEEIARIELVGLYLARRDEMSGLRLSMDAIHLLDEQISKNIIEINEEEFRIWIRGGFLDTDKGEGVYIVKFGDDFVGCGYSNGKKLYNFVPKERRIKR